mmetsp:Transcript_26637/g.49021  ORF Transcript_26637/g.49021 Transcript_26637/m.49021 type:complete len:696 (+) Transcript_26637:40-2127(+)
MMPRVHSDTVTAGMGSLRLLLLLCAGSFNVEVAATGSQATALALAGHGNPIRRVVKLISDMQSKVSAEGAKQEKSMDKFRCYCKKTVASLEKSIKAAEASIPQLEATIEEGKSAKAQLEGAVKKAKADAAAARAALASAAEIRKKEEAAFTGELNSLKPNIASLEKAIPAIEKGTASFLQSKEASVLQRLSVTLDMQSGDRDILTAFLSGSSSESDNNAEYAPGTGEILGILKQMKEGMEKQMAELIANEEASKSDFANLESAKKKELAALMKQTESQTARLGNLAVELVDAEDSLEDTSEGYTEDQAFLGNLKVDCKTKEAEYEKYKETQAAELLALSETIEILNSDDAAALLQKALPPTANSFMQIQVSAKDVKHRAVEVLAAQRKGRRAGDPRIDFLELALRGGKIGFEEIIKQIDQLMAVLNEEQKSDDARKAHCTKEIAKAEDEAKALSVTGNSLTKAIAEGKESMSSIATEITALSTGIKELDKAVVEATAQRKEENEDFKEALAEQGAAKDLLRMAKKRMAKFYSPETAASFMQVSAKSGNIQEAHQQKEDATGVMVMFDTLIKDIEMKITEMKHEETGAQESYENLLKDAQAKRALDAKAVMDKESAKGTVEEELLANTKSLKTNKAELAETDKYLASLHSECDFHLKYYDARKSARADELDGLDKAKAVLSGGDYSFLQLKSVSRH